jgi:activator of 2-hydroxyglutaryl-CoA dehydratase
LLRHPIERDHQINVKTSNYYYCPGSQRTVVHMRDTAMCGAVEVMTFLGIDLGTGSVKAAVVTEEGRVLAEAQRAYRVDSPQPGWAQSDPSAWLEAVWSATADVLKADARSGGGR